MSKRVFCTGLAIACFAVITGLPVMAESISITNGDFESIDSETGRFSGWTYSNTSGTATVSTSPTVIGGTNSARLLYGTSNGGALSQTVSPEGVADFTIEFDFAVLDIDSTSYRTLGVSSNDDCANVCVYYTSNGAEIRFYNGSAFLQTGLFASTTDDFGTAKSFGDNEVPEGNHLKLQGENFGTSNATLTVTLSGGETNGVYTGTSSGAQSNEFTTLKFFAYYRDADFLVDNVTVVPEPSSVALLAAAVLGLAVCAWRKRK